MPFPDEAIDVDVELLLGHLGWTSIKQRVYTRDPITITGGRTAEGSQPDPARCTMTLNNKDGWLSPRNPASPYHGLIGRNTPIRVSVPAEHPSILIPGGNADRLVAVGSETANITAPGIEVAVEMSNAQWGSGGTVLSKRTAVGDQRSWVLNVRDTGEVLFIWYTSGTNGSQHYTFSTAKPSGAEGRQALRVTVDTAIQLTKFYTGPSIDGPWTQLGDQRGPYNDVVPVFAGTAPVILGAEPTFINDATFAATYHAWRVLDGIGGTPIIDVNLDDLDVSGTSFVDDLGRTWNVEGDAELTQRQVRFAGEVPGWPIRWGPSGHDVHVPIEAAGITRRLGQGAKPVASALRRSIASSAPHTAWWPLEDSPGAQRAASGYLDRPPMRAVGAVTFSGEPVEGLGGSAEVGQSGSLNGPVTGGASEWVVAWWFDLPEITGTEDAFTNSVVLHWECPRSPGAAQWIGYARANPFTGVQEFTLQAADDAGGAHMVMAYAGPIWGAGPTQFALHARTDAVLGIIANLWVDGVMVQAGTTFGGDFVTPVSNVGLNNISILAGADTESAGTISHLLVADGARLEEVTDLVPAGHGYAGETAGTRITRITAEEGIPLTVAGEVAATAPMGAQLPATILDLLGEAAEADGGLLIDRRDTLALHYRARTVDYNAPVALELDYHDQVAHPLEPVDDDQQVRNDVSVERRGGSSARAVKEDGTLSVRPPPDGAGVYDEQVTLNLADDAQLVDQAGWRVHLGTVDEARYPVVGLKLHKHPDLIPAALALALRSHIRLTGLPAWMPPGDVDLIVDGYTEVIEPLRWTMEWNTVPQSPWRVGITDDPVYGRADTDGSHLLTAVDADDTTLLVASTSGPYWTTDPAEYPYDLVMGGEVLTATAAADGLADGFDRTVASGFGSAPDGQAWTVYGPASHYSVSAGSGGIAQVSFPATNAADVAGLAQHTEGVDIEVTLRTVVAPITGAPLYFYVIGCFDQTAFTWYALVVSMYPDGTVRALIEYKAPGGATSALTAERTIPGLAVTANAWRRARLRVQDGRIDGKVWADGSAEPDWQVTAFHGEYSGGDVGLQMFLPLGNTNALPVAFQVGEVLLHNPQRLTVTRSVNGVAKAHAAGADARLAQPMIIAL